MIKTKNIIMLTCKNCEHQFLQNITPYTINDIAKRDNDNKNSFWNKEFNCPKCGLPNHPSVIVFDLGVNDDISEPLKVIEKNDFLFPVISKDKLKLLMLDDYKKNIHGKNESDLS